MTFFFHLSCRYINFNSVVYCVASKTFLRRLQLIVRRLRPWVLKASLEAHSHTISTTSGEIPNLRSNVRGLDMLSPGGNLSTQPATGPTSAPASSTASVPPGANSTRQK
jgi:hypothetical protein